MRASGDQSVTIDHPLLGALELIAGTAPDGTGPQVLFCENETNFTRLYGVAPVTPYPKEQRSPQAAQALFHREIARWGEVVRENHIQAQTD